MSEARLQSQGRAAAAALAAASVASLLASGCCVLPLVFVLLGVSGTWIGQLHRLAPYSPWLTGAALLSLASVGWWLYRSNPSPACDGEVVCANTVPLLRRWFWPIVALALLPVAATLFAPSFY